MPRRKRPARTGIAVELQIDGETWRLVGSLDASGPDDRHFVASTDESGATTLRFGDGEHAARLPASTDRVVAAYGSSKRFVAVVQQQGRVIVDRDWPGGRPGGRSSLRCVSRRRNVDPTSQARVQVQVLAVLAGQPLWAMPCRPVGGASVPPVGAGVWVTFEGGDPSRPVWMGITQ